MKESERGLFMRRYQKIC